MTRLPADFVKILDYNDIVVVLNTSENFSADHETVRYIAPQLADAEAPAWDYYKALAQEAGLPGKFQQWQTYPILRSYNLASAGGSLSPVNVWLRSAYRNGATSAWYIDTSGIAIPSYAHTVYSSCPACKIKTSE